MLLACVIFFPAASVAQTQNYQLGPGDVLTVIVLRHPEMSAEQVTVTSNGGIYVPVAGRVQVTGKTVEQVANQITTLLRVRLVRPEVTVTLREARPRQVFVLGAVAKPGVYAFQPGWRVSEVLAISGGLIARPELTEAILSRANRNPIPLNLAAILTNSNQPENVALQPGDTVRFTVRSLSITVTGQVIKSGTYDVPPGTGVVEALAIAGGAAPKAALSKVTVKHLDGSVVPVDLYKVMVLGQQAGDLALQAGDMVTVPESQARISVIGAVQKAGYYDIPDGTTMRVADALTAAGGPTPQASLTRASIRHADGSAEPVDLYKILVRGDGAGNVQLAPGDIVSVPESKGVTVLGAVTKPGTLNVEQGASPHLADILAQAGGLNIKPEAAHITITRTIANGQSKTVDVDPVALLEQRDPRQNESVQEGDLITVSTAKSNVVFISGEVKTPGMYELKEGDSVPELIARAGGPTPQASLAHINVVERDGTTQIVNALMNNGQKPNLPLQEGDYVVVPKNTARVLVMNAVNQPGYVAIPENGKLTLGEALIATGGPKDRAKLHQVAVMRQSPTGIDQRVVSLDKVYNGQMAVNITLQDGDVVYVPQGNQSGSSLSAITSVLGTLGIFGSLFRHN
ncbi:MAG: SLBB domain-containing protein [Abitibacteriaceae bacterium]|nr:SLBB domain-containing protein [Abditibacteriaceae bacterium]